MKKIIRAGFLAFFFSAVSVCFADTITLTAYNVNGTTTLINSEFSVYGYCLDQNKDTFAGIPVTYTISDLASQFPVNFSNKIAGLLDLGLSSATRGQAKYDIQEAIWLLAEGKTFTFNQDINKYLQMTFNIADYSLYKVFIPISGESQRFAYRDIPREVPEPASLLLLGSGLALIAFRKRRKMIDDR